MKNNSPIQNIEVYLDYATIPSLNYFLHFAENYKDTQSIRLFGLGRFQIPESIISAYPTGLIRYVPVSVLDLEDFNNTLFSIIWDSKKKVKLNLHLNLFHSFQMLGAILSTIRFFIDKIEAINLNLYDDGAEGITTLYKLANNNKHLDKKIFLYKKDLKEILTYIFEETGNSSNYFTYDLSVIRYLMSNVFPSKYILLKPDYLEKENRLLPLKESIGNNYQKIDFNHYQSFSSEQKNIFLSILDLPTTVEESLCTLNDENYVVFMGTTSFIDTQNQVTIRHLTFIQQFLDKNSPNYIGDNVKLFFKGHPHAKETNQIIAERFPQILCLNENVPFEILYFLGFKPKYIGSFAGTSYLFLPKEKIFNAIFVVGKDEDKPTYENTMQSQLSQLMLDLGYLSSEQVIYC